MFRSLTEKHHISFLMIQSVYFTSTSLESCQGICIFFSICLSKKNAEVSKFLEILKKYVSDNNIFVQERRAMFCLVKKIIFVFHIIFRLDFITQITYSIIHRCLYLHFMLFCSFKSVYKKWNIETRLTFPYSYNWQRLTPTTK